MTTDVRQRLRNANPASVTGQLAPDDLLQRVLAEPRAAARRVRRSMLRRPPLLIAAAVLLLGGTAAGVSRFAVDYFGSDDSEPTPAAIVAALRRVALEQPDYFGPIDAKGFVRLAAFDGPNGRVTLYVAPASKRDAYCVASATGDEVTGGSCHSTTVPGLRIAYGQGWNSDFGDVATVHGRLPANVAAIEVRFQDGAVRPASVRRPWWIYVVGGEETEPGHAPIELVARGADGDVVATQELNPYTFLNKAAIEDAIPAGDGSPEQNAVRTTLVRLGPFGVPISQQVRLEETRLVRTVQTSRGSFDVYAAPWDDGGVCFGYFNNGLNIEHITSGCPSDEYVPKQESTFNGGEINVYAARAGFGVATGPPPIGSERVSVLFEDGSSADADISRRSFFVFWFDADRLVPGHRPQEIVARDAEGHVIDTFQIDPGLLKH
jgi:hypothetical protein